MVEVAAAEENCQRKMYLVSQKLAILLSYELGEPAEWNYQWHTNKKITVVKL